MIPQPRADKMTNIHDYLESIGAEPPPIDEKSLADAKAKIIWCDSIEEAVENLDKSHDPQPHADADHMFNLYAKKAGVSKPMTTPQNVTSRYARNLLVKGKNDEFHVLSLKRQQHYVDSVWIGNYYIVEITGSTGTKTGVGVTPEYAINQGLTKHGVTFR